MKYALMFNVLKDGEIEPINWSKDIFKPNLSIILLEELTPAVWLWHGSKQSLVDRRIASRQAESLKGYGYKAHDTIIGRRTRIIKEIDQRKIGKDPETDKINLEFEEILSKEINPIDEVIVSFQLFESEFGKLELKPKAVYQPKETQEPKSPSDSFTKKLAEKIQKPTVQNPQIKTVIHSTKQVSKPLKHLKKQEYSFESQVEEVRSVDTTGLVNEILNRIERMELKLDNLINDFGNLKKLIIEK